MIEQLISTRSQVEIPFVPPAVEPGNPFQGFVSSDDLIDGTALSSLLALTSGTSINNKAGWLKYIDAGKTFYIARKPLRYGTTVAAYKAAALLAGKQVSIRGDIYKVRLMSGMAADPFNSIIGIGGGGEWNQYLYPIFAAANRPTAAVWSYYTAADLGLALNDSLNGQKGWITVTKDQHNTITTALAARGWDYSGGTGVNPIDRRTVINDANVNEGNGTASLDVYGFRPLLEFIGVAPPEDLYYGEIADADFITPSALAAVVNLAAVGTVTNASSNWLKYRYKGKTTYLAKKPLRHAMTWEQMDAVGVVKGNIPYLFGGKRYALTLPTGADVDPTPSYGSIATAGSFNDLIYPVYGGAASGQPEVLAYPRWAAFTDADLGFATNKAAASGGLGTLTWCKEVITGGGSHLLRGYNDADNVGNRQILAGWYVANGGTQQYAGWRPQIEELTDLSNAWSRVGNLPAARMNIGSASVSGKIYTFGGDANDGSNPTGAFSVYDPVLATWTAKAVGPAVRTWHCMCEGTDGKVYVHAGYSSSGVFSDLWAYDPVANTWAQKASGIDRYDGVMTSYGGKLYVVGGYTNTYANDLRCYDIATNTWSVKASFVGGRRHMTLNAVNGKLYMSGGNVGGTEFWSYDIATDVWTKMADHPMGNIAQHRSTVVDGKIYFFGGNVGGTVVKKLWVYDPVGNTWTQLADMLTTNGKTTPFMVAPGDGRIYIGGGYYPGVGVLSDFWTYKP
jgi:N-acetylneuraminic acid mutarotase